MFDGTKSRNTPRRFAPPLARGELVCPAAIVQRVQMLGATSTRLAAYWRYAEGARTGG
ncbi:MAG: hypothetical protein K0Q77_1048 [Anaerosporomusa subterranea]|jgi:hypothetical protein|nr:hypothetical protein [Anaerosporomusa subterranea]